MTALQYFLQAACLRDCPEMLRLVEQMSRDDLAQARKQVCVPDCDCQLEIDHCGCEPDGVQARQLIPVRCRAEGCLWKGEEQVELPRYLHCLRCGSANLERRKATILQRASCGCPVHFKPCAVHQPVIAVPAEVEWAILWRLQPKLYADRRRPPVPIDLEPGDSRRIVAVMSKRVRARFGPRHPGDGWIDEQRASRAADALATNLATNLRSA